MTPSAKNESVEPIIYVLVGLIVFFAVALVYCEHQFPQDGQVFQVFSNVLSGVSGALMMRVKPSNSGADSSTNIGNTVIAEAPVAGPTLAAANTKETT
jgi:hypothetical protein